MVEVECKFGIHVKPCEGGGSSTYCFGRMKDLKVTMRDKNIEIKETGTIFESNFTTLSDCNSEIDKFQRMTDSLRCCFNYL